MRKSGNIFAADTEVDVTDRPAQISEHAEKLKHSFSQRVDIGPHKLTQHPTKVINDDLSVKAESADAKKMTSNPLSSPLITEDKKSQDYMLIENEDIGPYLDFDDHEQQEQNPAKQSNLSTERHDQDALEDNQAAAVVQAESEDENCDVDDEVEVKTV